jgi:hypothetical protein
MPIRKGKDKRGSYMRWGKRNKYYFNPKSKISQSLAKKKAEKQAVAIYASRWKQKVKQSFIHICKLYLIS